MNSWIIENLGLTLLHSLWQIGFIAIILFSVLRILHKFSANLRYFAAITALIFSLCLPIATFVYLSTDSPSSRQTTSSNQTTFATEIKSQNIQQQLTVTEKSENPIPDIKDNTVFSPSQKINLLPILVSLWIIGVGIFSIRLMGGIWTVHRYKTKNITAVSRDWQEKFDELCRQLQIKQSVSFLQSKMVEMPVVIGWLKPVVLVPASAFLQISPRELETILIHELTHVRRNDYFINLAQSLAEILFFYHPCVWWMSSQIRQEREFAVDEFVSQVFEKQEFIYANALANLEEIRLNSNLATPALAMAGDGGDLMKRIEKILGNYENPGLTNVSTWSAVFAITFILGITGGIYWLKTSEVKNNKSGRKIAVIISGFSDNKNESKSYHDLLKLQNKYKIPATWILDSKLIDLLKQDKMPPDFFSKTIENKSDFILNVPNISYTIFMNGDDEYIDYWKNQIQFVEEGLTKQNYKLNYFTNGYSSQIPQEMDNCLMSRGLKLMELPLLSSGYEFHFLYEIEYVLIDGKVTFRDTNEEKQKEIKEKYIRYINELFEFNSKYYEEKFGRAVPQILKLGTTELTSASADELLQSLKDQGYEFVSLEELLSDEIYKKSLEKQPLDREFFKQQFKIVDKYRDKDIPLSPNRIRHGKSEFKVDVDVKDLKIKAK